MATVKINNKTYPVPELTFHHSRMMEQMGLPMTGINSPQYFFTAVSAFTAICTNAPIEQADYLVEQHVLGGGDIQDIYKAFVAALNESGFFKKLLGLEEEKQKNSKKSAPQNVE